MMIKFLIVINHGYDIDIAEYQQELSDCGVIITRETDQFMRVVCEHDPHVIVSLGTVGQLSLLWSLPLWRRMRWLNLPDPSVGARSVRHSALSLIAATSTGALFRDQPLICCLTLDEDAQDIARSIIHITENIEYDNIEFLVPDTFFAEVVDALGVHKSLGGMCRVITTTENTVLSNLRNVLVKTRAEFVWPVSVHNMVQNPNFLETVMGLLLESVGTAAIIGKNLTRGSVLGYLDGERENPIDQLIFKHEQILKTFQFEQDFPLTSLSGLVLHLINDSATQFVSNEDTVGSAPQEWYSESDRNHRMLLQSLVKYSKQLQTSQN